jgi:predicted  nucleic acid-binding Zn-ribbon protein
MERAAATRLLKVLVARGLRPDAPLADAAIKNIALQASQLIASNESDKAGQDIIKLLEKVAADRRHALETAQRLSHELQNAENRIAQLEAEVQLYKAKMERAKQWLHNIFSAIEERLLG